MEKGFTLGALAAFVSTLVGWVILKLKQKLAGAKADVGRGDSAGIAAIVRTATEQSGDLAGTAAESAADSGRVAEDLQGAADIIRDVIDEGNKPGGNADRADQLFSELLRRHGKGNQEAEDTE